MPLLTILIAIVVAGLILWLVNSYIPMDRKIKTIFNIVVVIVLIIWLLKVFGVFHLPDKYTCIVHVFIIMHPYGSFKGAFTLLNSKKMIYIKKSILAIFMVFMISLLSSCFFGGPGHAQGHPPGNAYGHEKHHGNSGNEGHDEGHKK